MGYFKEIVFDKKEKPKEENMVTVEGCSKAIRFVRGMPRFKTREDAEIGKTWAEKQYRKKYTVVKNAFGDDFYLRKK